LGGTEDVQKNRFKFANVKRMTATRAPVSAVLYRAAIKQGIQHRNLLKLGVCFGPAVQPISIFNAQ
jgi:hypothetical protein